MISVDKMTQQLALGIEVRDDATFANFFVGNNLQTIASLEKLARNEGEQFIYLWGSLGSGRSHLLQACCHADNDESVYVPLGDNPYLTATILPSLEDVSLVCIDDVNNALGRDECEEALFHFYNHARQQKIRLVVAGNAPPTQLPCRLADLQSRLSWGLTYQVKELNDEQIILALQIRAYNRGLQLPREVAEYVLRRFTRNMNSLFELLVKLDRASLIAKRRLTIPFVREALKI